VREVQQLSKILSEWRPWLQQAALMLLVSRLSTQGLRPVKEAWNSERQALVL
jgi:hypothetical protein